jgi:phosphoribosylformylglycinamidine synthase
MGKFIELMVDGTTEDEARAATEEVCRRLLANPVMEDFTYELEKM